MAINESECKYTIFRSTVSSSVKPRPIFFPSTNKHNSNLGTDRYEDGNTIYDGAKTSSILNTDQSGHPINATAPYTSPPALQKIFTLISSRKGGGLNPSFDFPKMYQSLHV